MTTTPRSVLRARTLTLTCAAALAAATLAGCGGDSGATSSTPTSVTTSSATTGSASASSTAALTLEDGWVKAAPGGMTALFGVLRNTSGTEMTVLSGTSPAARSVELHEVAMVDGAMKMRPKAGGIVIPAGGTHELKPGGDHIMLLGLREAVKAGQDVTVTLTTSGGVTVEVTGIGKEFAGGNETYAPSGGAAVPGPGGSGSPGMPGSPGMSGSTGMPGGMSMSASPSS